MRLSNRKEGWREKSVCSSADLAHEDVAKAIEKTCRYRKSKSRELNLMHKSCEIEALAALLW
jgi:hypothetical protein